MPDLTGRQPVRNRACARVGYEQHRRHITGDADETVRRAPASSRDDRSVAAVMPAVPRQVLLPPSGG